jgi:proline iminopeptidase
MPLSRRNMLLALNAAMLPLGQATPGVKQTATPYVHRFRSRMVEIADTRLEVLEAGEGPTTFACTHPYFDASGPFPAGGLTEALAAAGRVFYVCPRGTAGSAKEQRREKLTLSQLADDMQAVRQALAIKTWVPAGSSTGGMTALLHGLRYPDSTAGLILSSTVPSYRFSESPSSLYNPANPAFKELAALEKKNNDAAYARAKMLASLHNKSVLDLVLQNTRIQHERESVDDEEIGTDKWDEESNLGKITAPTLIIAGRFDVPVGSLDPSFKILKSINGSEYAIMNGSGHFPYDEEPERYQQVIADFSRRRLDPH